MFDILYLAAETTSASSAESSALSGTAIFAWVLFLTYMVVTFYLAYLGHKATKSFADFAVGKRDMNPWVAGLTMGACLASTATFLINPGFVYHFGLSAIITYSVPLLLGIFAGMFLLGPGFRKHGDKALTMPLWVGERYQSRGLRTWFATLSLLNIFYIVLIVKGSAIIMQNVMSLPYHVALVVVILVVFTYVTFGGTYAHAYTNTAQGAMMLVVALLMVGFAAKGIFSEAGAKAIEVLDKRDPNFFAMVYPKSPLFGSVIEVFVVPFVMGFVIITQPHLLIKTLYLKSSKEITKFALVAGMSFVVFTCILFAGLAARLADIDITDAAKLTKFDNVTAIWISKDIGGYLASFISIAILAAAMSTLDGLLVAVSAIIGADVVTHPVFKNVFKIESQEDESKASMIGGQITIFALGLSALIICWNPPEAVGIFAIYGVYGLLATTAPAFILGIFLKNPLNAKAVLTSSFVSLAVYTICCLCALGKLDVIAKVLPEFLISRNPGYLAMITLALGFPLNFVLSAIIPDSLPQDLQPMTAQPSEDKVPA